MKGLKGKVAVITGGNSGIGLATAKRLVEEGAKVVISGRNAKTLADATKSIGNGTLAVQSDVANLADIDKLYKETVEKFGKIDILFVNAGVAKFVLPGDVTEAHYDEIFDTNAKGAYFTIQKALPYLNDGASIVLNASVAGQIGLPTSSVYSATKAALRSMARSFAAALADRNIRVNVVSPGPIETPIFDRLGLSKQEVDDFLTYAVTQVPLKRVGKADEVAATVAFLASSEASYVNAVEINVDGGMGQV